MAKLIITYEDRAAVSDVMTDKQKPLRQVAWMIAMRYLNSRRYDRLISLSSLIAIVGIALGVTTLIIVLSVMNGLRQELLTKILGLDGHIIIQPLNNHLDDEKSLLTKILKIPGVTNAMPIVEGQVLASGAFKPSGAFVRGISRKKLREFKPVMDGGINDGDIDDFGQKSGIIIGSGLASTLGATVGDSISLLSPNGTVTPFGVTPRRKSYPILATFSIKMAEYDNSFIFMPLAEADKYFGGSGARVILVYSDDPDQVDELKSRLRTTITDSGEMALMTDWRERNFTFFSALEVERDAMFFILTMIVLVAVFNIVTAITMLVNAKSKEIAILRTMGASRGMIVRIFIGFGATLGMVGTLTGSIIGIIVSLNIESLRQLISSLLRTQVFPPQIYRLSELPARINLIEIVVIITVTLLLSFLASIYPAWRAGRMDPVEGLRYE